MKKTSERVAPDQQLTIEDQLIFQMHFKTYMHAAPFAKDKTVLDIGSGDGYGTYYLKDYARHITGVDIDQESVRQAREKYQASNLTFQQLTEEILPFENDTFDCVVSFQVIEHLRHAELFLNEIHRVLKPGGHLLISTPNAAIRLLFFQNSWNKHHIREFTMEDLRTLLKKRFANIQFWGLTLKEPYLTMERRRTDRNKWILWPFSIRLWPCFFRRCLLNCLWRAQTTFRRLKNEETVTIKDVALISESDIADAPSLIVAAQKP